MIRMRYALGCDGWEKWISCGRGKTEKIKLNCDDVKKIPMEIRHRAQMKISDYYDRASLKYE